MGHVDRCDAKNFFSNSSHREICAPLLVWSEEGERRGGEKEKENGRQRTSKCSVDKFLSQQNGQSYRPPPRFYSGVFATLARLDQQNSVCLVTLAQARLKPRIDLKVSYVFPHRSSFLFNRNGLYYWHFCIQSILHLIKNVTIIVIKIRNRFVDEDTNMLLIHFTLVFGENVSPFVVCPVIHTRCYW